jgi:hypothetical protein
LPTSTLGVSAFFIFLDDYHGRSKGHACELFPLRISDVRLDHLVRRRVGSGSGLRSPGPGSPEGRPPPGPRPGDITQSAAVAADVAVLAIKRARSTLGRSRLRSRAFLDAEPDSRHVPQEVVEAILGAMDVLREEWDETYPENPIESQPDEE